MKLSADQLRTRFRNASAQFILANSSVPTRGSSPAPVVECTPRSSALRPRKGKGASAGLFLVRITSRRRRLLDEDNLAEKYHVDCCRYAGVLPSDAAGKAQIETRQEKVGCAEDECTVIEILQVAPAGEIR